MKVIIYMFLVLSMLFISVYLKKSKGLYTLILIFCWIVIAFCMDSYDISNYRYAYDAMFRRGKEPLFDVLQVFFASAGFPFEVFKVLYGTVMTIWLYKGLKQYTQYAAFAAALFVLAPMTGFATQMRNSMAGAIIIYATYLLLKKKRRSTWEYCGLVLLASMFHATALFYFVYLIPKLIPMRVRTFRRWAYLAFLVLLVVFMVLPGKISNALYSLQSVMGKSTIQTLVLRMAQYFGGGYSPNFKGFAFSACYHLVIYGLTEWSCYKMKKIARTQKIFYDVYAIEMVQKLNLIILLIVPCYAISIQFSRFFNYFVPVCYGVLVQGVGEMRKLYKRFSVGTMAFLILMACLFFGCFVGNFMNGYTEFSRIINGITFWW